MNKFTVTDKLTNYSQKSLNARTVKVLLAIGVPPNIKGYYYLLTSIMIAYQEPEITEFVTKDLYRRIAKKYSASPSCVERAIRYAIAKTFESGSHEVLKKYFVSCRKPPSGGKFIAEVAARLRAGLL